MPESEVRLNEHLLGLTLRQMSDMDGIVSKQSLRPWSVSPERFRIQVVFWESLVHGSACFPGGEAAATLTLSLCMWPVPNLYTGRTLAT